jgi:hypothetical protein
MPKFSSLPFTMMIPTVTQNNIFQYMVLHVKTHNISFRIEPREEEEGMGRSVIVVLRSLNEAVDRIECCVGRIYYILWSPDGKQIGELSVCRGISVSSDRNELQVDRYESQRHSNAEAQSYVIDCLINYGLIQC